MSWDVPYEPGTLKAIGTRDGKAVATLEVSTTGDPAAIQLESDREIISAGRRDVAHFTVKIVDDRGLVVPLADNEMTFKLERAGNLIGVDNGDMRSHEDYKSNRRRAFYGLCMALIQSAAVPGEIRLTAASPGLKPGSARIAAT